MNASQQGNYSLLVRSYHLLVIQCNNCYWTYSV